MLDLVHLDHAIRLENALPLDEAELAISAHVADVAETSVGRVVTVIVKVDSDGGRVASMTERFAIRGRGGAQDLADPVRVGGAFVNITETPRRSRVHTTIEAPIDMHAFAEVSCDHNPIHTNRAAARLAGLGEPIVHGMWLSAAAQQAVADRRITGWTTRFLATLSPGVEVDISADRVGIDNGAEIVEVTCRADGEIIMSATARLEAPHTAYAFPGQGIQHQGLGMDGYGRSRAARNVWDRADAHARSALGFSILTAVRDNPTVLTVNGETHRHPDGVLFLTQFTQVANITCVSLPPPRADRNLRLVCLSKVIGQSPKIAPDSVIRAADGESLVQDLGCSHMELLAERMASAEPDDARLHSDYFGFIEAGIPAGGLFTGAEGIKSAEQAALFVGTAGVAYDECYHSACDEISNINGDTRDLRADAIAHSTRTFAETTSAVNGTSKGKAAG